MAVDPTTCASDTLRLWSYLPQFVQDSDAAGGIVNRPTGSEWVYYQFLNWLEGVVNCEAPERVSASGLQDLDDLCRDSEIAIGWSSIMDISRCPTYALPWLAQFVGVRFSGEVLGSTNVDQAMRIAILSEVSFKRGTVAAIKAAVAPYLSPEGYVNIIERYPTPYSLTVQIIGGLGSLTYAQLAAKEPIYSVISHDYPYYSDLAPSATPGTVTAVINASIPAGLIATVVFL